MVGINLAAIKKERETRVKKAKAVAKGEALRSDRNHRKFVQVTRGISLKAAQGNKRKASEIDDDDDCTEDDLENGEISDEETAPLPYGVAAKELERDQYEIIDANGNITIGYGALRLPKEEDVAAEHALFHSMDQFAQNSKDGLDRQKDIIQKYTKIAMLEASIPGYEPATIDMSATEFQRQGKITTYVPDPEGEYVSQTKTVKGKEKQVFKKLSKTEIAEMDEESSEKHAEAVEAEQKIADDEAMKRWEETKKRSHFKKMKP